MRKCCCLILLSLGLALAVPAGMYPPGPGPAAAASATGLQSDFIQVAHLVMPSVVSLKAVKMIQSE
ncbi:MAG: hypothetical protein WA433_03425, partial [Desulfobaccales bacterium]